MTAPARQPHPIPARCSAQEARALTDQIKGSVERTWGLLIAAYERQAWKALDYTSWHAYVTAEFGISRSRSYQLIDQATVVREIQAAADVSTPVDISEAVARDVKPHLEQVAEQVHEAVAHVDEPDRAEVAAQVVRDAREQIVADRRTGEVLSEQEWAARNDDLTAPPAEDDDAWAPSAAVDKPPTPVAPQAPSPARPSAPAGKSSSRPVGVDQDFAAAVRELQKAVNHIDRLTADGRFVFYARKLNDKYRPTISEASEGLEAILTRLTDIAARTKASA